MRKQLLVLLFLLFTTTSCIGEPVNITVVVVDTEGLPIKGAMVKYTFKTSAGVNSVLGETNSKGKDSKLRLASRGVSYEVSKDGYYLTKGGVGYGSQKVNVTLHKKLNPIPMKAKSVRFDVGEEGDGKWIGYDVFKGDFVAPYGEGVVSDFEFRRRYTQTLEPFTYKFDFYLRFPNEGDGLIPFVRPVIGSELKSEHMAPDGNVLSSLYVYRYHDRDSDGFNSKTKSNINRMKNYYLRIRSIVNEDGEVTSAHYGKIYGDFGLNEWQKIYLNVNLNDRNIEFDPLVNLFVGMEKEERVWEP